MSLLKATDQVKRKWSKLAQEEKKSLYTSEQQATDIIIHPLLVNHFELDTSVIQQVQNLQHVTGLVKNYGQDLEVLQKVHQKIDKENISIFALCLI